MSDWLSRKLAVILHADVVGSTRLVQLDETLAHERIRDAFRSFSDTIRHHNGIAHEIRGDALVAEFPMASDAVSAALAFQSANAAHVEGLTDAVRPVVRVGIAMGEVVVADKTVTGAGVVLAQRLEQLAKPGGVVIQGAAHETVPTRLPFDYENLGELELKGFDGPVRAYAVTLRPGADIPKIEPKARLDRQAPDLSKTLSEKGYSSAVPMGLREEAVTTSLPIGSGPITRLPRRRLGVWLAVLSVLLVVAGVALYIFPGPEKQGGVPENVVTGRPISIAVLPFDNLSGDPAQQYFVDGIADDLITDLAVIKNMMVISRDSSSMHREGARDLSSVARALNVRYIVHGSVRKENDRVRINAHLTDTATGAQIWANRYEGSTREIFELQDRITESVISALALRLTSAQRQYVERPGTTNLKAYEYYLHGTEQFFRYAKASNLEARQFFLKAIELDPKMAKAYAMLAWTHAFDFMNGWSGAPQQSLENAEKLATQALALDKALPVAYFVRGLVHRERGDYVKALVEAERAIALDPNYANGHVLYATLLYYAGRPQEGLEEMKKAIRLSPHHPFNYPFHLGQAYFVLKHYDEAIAAFKQGLASNPSEERLHVWLAAAYAQSGKLDEARWEAEQVLLTNPKLSLQQLKEAFPFSDPADLANFLEGLRKAGFSG